MARVKKVETSIETYDQANERLGQLREVRRQIAEITAWKEKKMKQIEDQTRQRLCASGVDLTVQEKALEADLLAFVESRREEFSGGNQRSRKLPNGILGLRLGTGAVKTVKGVTFKAVEANPEWMRQLRAWGWTKRPPEKLDKAGILEAFRAAGQEGAPQRRTVLDRLSRCGLTVEQSDEPFIEPAEAEVQSVAEPGVIPLEAAA